MYVVCEYDLYFGGGSYSSVYVQPQVCIFHGSYGVYPCTTYLQCVNIHCVYLFLYTHIPIDMTLYCLKPIVMKIIHDWGCMHMCYIICS